MRSETKSPNKRHAAAGHCASRETAANDYRIGVLLPLTAAALAFGLAFVLMLAGCAPTVIPAQVRDHGASYDGNERNSGFLGFAADGTGIITPRARARYNELVARYGGLFRPALSADEGITPTATNTFLIDGEHLVDFATMNRWRKETK